jgi:hypothetical protein
LPPPNPAAPVAIAPQTNAVASLANSGLNSKPMLATGAAILAVAAGLTLWMVIRARRMDHTSLITRSMNYHGKPPPRV